MKNRRVRLIEGDSLIWGRQRKYGLNHDIYEQAQADDIPNKKACTSQFLFHECIVIDNGCRYPGKEIKVSPLESHGSWNHLPDEEPE